MRSQLCAVLAVAVFSLAHAQDSVRFEEMTDKQRESIKRGIAWLLKNQNPDGLWGCEKSGAPSTAITGLSALALAAGGSTPGEGEHREIIAKTVAKLLSIQARSGQITRHDSTGMGIFYDHSCATLALAEFYGMQKDPTVNEELARGLRKAIGFLYTKQNRDGGFDAQGQGGHSDLAITCNVWMALRSAHNAGMAIEGANVERVEEFVKKCTEPGGGFNQHPTLRGGGGRMFYPTSAGLRILYGMGKGDTKEVEAGVKLLLTKRLGQDYGGQISEWDYCGGFYAVQALLHENGPAWRKWYGQLRDHLLKIQNADGSWTIEYCLCCRAYATSLALLMLQAPNRLLPIFQL
jgi:prenyltransferase beta subunit